MKVMKIYFYSPLLVFFTDRGREIIRRDKMIIRAKNAKLEAWRFWLTQYFKILCA